MEASIKTSIKASTTTSDSISSLANPVEGSAAFRCNLIIVFNQAGDQVLMCRRRKNPYEGLLNFVGGKVKLGEDSLASSYRELEEETSITSSDIVLYSMMDILYHVWNIKLEVFYGTLNKMFHVEGDENDLVWLPITDNFFDNNRFAGNGNVGHMIIIALQQLQKERTVL